MDHRSSKLLLGFAAAGAAAGVEAARIGEVGVARMGAPMPMPMLIPIGGGDAAPLPYVYAGFCCAWVVDGASMPKRLLLALLKLGVAGALDMGARAVEEAALSLLSMSIKLILLLNAAGTGGVVAVGIGEVGAAWKSAKSSSSVQATT